MSLRFISLLLEGEAMSAACLEFGISRKTGYKIYQRYKHSGSEAFNDRSRRPYRYANQLPPQLETQIIRSDSGVPFASPNASGKQVESPAQRKMRLIHNVIATYRRSIDRLLL